MIISVIVDMHCTVEVLDIIESRNCVEEFRNINFLEK